MHSAIDVVVECDMLIKILVPIIAGANKITLFVLPENLSIYKLGPTILFLLTVPIYSIP